MPEANHRVKESCLICEGLGRSEAGPCAYCQGSGVVFARQGAPRDILVSTGDCKLPLKRLPRPA